MSTPTDGATSQSPTKAKGCGARGCLFGCLTPIVVLGLAVLFALPTLREKWAGFQAEHPWVSQVPAVAGVLKDVVASRDTGKTSTDTSSGRAPPKQLKGVNDKAAMPKDLPLWPSPKTEAFSAGEGHAAAYQQVRQPSDSVLRYFRRTMPAQGWRLDQERTGAGGTLLLYRKADRIARVEVVAHTAGTDIWLRSRSTAARQR